ncbi:MAG: hypothetical protein VKS61_17965 [Candidatus Sericytochromatia bacterium]|nr:hypothetical protein [Candidatus Sericytochromatia bacterium]
MMVARATLLACLALACTACQLPPGYVAHLQGGAGADIPVRADQPLR